MALRPKPSNSQLGRAFELGLEVSLAVVLGMGLGYYADGRFGTAPAFMLVGLALGFATAILSVYRFARKDSPHPGPGRDGGSGETDG